VGYVFEVGVRFLLSIKQSKLAQGVMLLQFIRKVMYLNLGGGVEYPD
jgi:hypothetical protein